MDFDLTSSSAMSSAALGALSALSATSQALSGMQVLIRMWTVHHEYSYMVTTQALCMHTYMHERMSACVCMGTYARIKHICVCKLCVVVQECLCTTYICV